MALMYQSKIDSWEGFSAKIQLMQSSYKFVGIEVAKFGDSSILLLNGHKDQFLGHKGAKAQRNSDWDG